MTYLIKYTIFDQKGGIIKIGKMRVKNKPNELVAKCSLETFLKKKYPAMVRMVVHSCEPDTGQDIFDFLRGFDV